MGKNKHMTEKKHIAHLIVKSHHRKTIIKIGEKKCWIVNFIFPPDNYVLSQAINFNNFKSRYNFTLMGHFVYYKEDYTRC